MYVRKKEGLIRVDKLRAILLLEADFNFGTKLLFGKRMMSQMEEHDIIPKEQFGSRQQHSAIEVAINRRILMDISRQTHQTLGIIGADAANCYDRVVHSYASMMSRSWGMPQAPLHTMFSTIQQMKMKVRTGYGESTLQYGGFNTPSMQGTCQGNGASPTIWVGVSSILIKSLYQQGFQSQITCPITKSSMKMVGLMYVDDADLIHLDNSVTSRIQMKKKLQNILNCWNSGLKQSGGSPSAQKCYWYSIQMYRDKYNWKYKKKTISSYIYRKAQSLQR